MLGISFAELLLIMLVLLLVFGPERLPKIAQTLAGIVRQLQQVSEQVNSEIQQLSLEDTEKTHISNENKEEAKEIPEGERDDSQKKK